MDAQHRQTVVAIALVPCPQVGQRPDRVELREVEEVDQDRMRRGEAVDGLHRVTDPVQAGGDGGDGDVGSRGTQAPEGMLPQSPMNDEEWF